LIDTENVAETVTLRACIRNMAGSNLGRHTTSYYGAIFVDLLSPSMKF